MKQFLLPDPGEGLVEADIVTWRVTVGDVVEINDIVVEIETAKSLVELPIPYAGTVVELLVNEGDTVDVGAPIISIDTGADAEAAPAAPAQPERVANLVGYGPRTGASRRRARKGSDDQAGPAGLSAAAGPAASMPAPRSADAVSHESHPVLAKPPVRKLAADLGVDLATVTGSGEGSIITRSDVLAAQGAATPRPIQPAAERSLDQSAAERSLDQPAAQRSPEQSPSQRQLEQPIAEPASPPSTPFAGARRVPIKGVRKQMAQAVVSSAFTAPHVTEWVTIDVTATVELLERLQRRREFRELKLTPTLLVAKAVCFALARNGDLNARWDAETGEIVYPPHVNLGIATATPRGLLVPNISRADTLDLAELATAFAELVSAARAGRTPAAHMFGGTFTITNIGVFDVDAGTPILNTGESGILAVGAIKRRPWVVGVGEDERIEPRWVTTLALSFDHRVVDGATGSRFLADVAAVLIDPGLALLQ